jgi:hypothetical protein
MVRLTYSIQVCNESRELFSLLNFIVKVKDEEDNIHVVVDTNNITEKVEKVLEYFGENITLFRRPFDDFCKNSQFHADNATGDYVFGIDADEMPQEFLIKRIKDIIRETSAEIVAIPRINIHPGITQDFIERYKININEMGFINWPDYQLRIYKKCDHITWSDTLHTKLQGSDKVVGLKPDPQVALWHVKSMEKQLNRWKPNGDEGDDTTFSPPSDNLYDILM